MRRGFAETRFCPRAFNSYMLTLCLSLGNDERSILCHMLASEPRLCRRFRVSGFFRRRNEGNARHSPKKNPPRTPTSLLQGFQKIRETLVWKAPTCFSFLASIYINRQCFCIYPARTPVVSRAGLVRLDGDCPEPWAVVSGAEFRGFTTARSGIFYQQSRTDTAETNGSYHAGNTWPLSCPGFQHVWLAPAEVKTSK